MDIMEMERQEVMRVILMDGHTFKVRAIRSIDKEKLHDFFYCLSA
jgi:hypothetical protein